MLKDTSDIFWQCHTLAFLKRAFRHARVCFQNARFWDSEDCVETVSDTFWTPGPEGPGRLFGDFFGVPGPEGPGGSCKGLAGLRVQATFRKLPFEPPPQTSEKSLDELFRSGGWLENCLTDTARSIPLSASTIRAEPPVSPYHWAL